MTKPLPLLWGQFYHIYNRGIDRQPIFFQERNYRYFLQLYTRYVGPIVETFAYCLLPNHFHFLVRIKDEDAWPGIDGLSAKKEPSKCIGNWCNAYAKAVNKAYRRTGSLFQRPFGRKLVTSDEYFVHLVAYIHRNAQKHGLVEKFDTWPYSSYHTILTTQPTFIQRTGVLDWFGGAAPFRSFHEGVVAEGLLAPLVEDDFD
jgi:putative transposase